MESATTPSDGERRRGKVKWFNCTKGFGFVIPADGSTELFLHQSALKMTGFRSVWEGDEVEYDIDESGAKPQAVNVTGPGGKPLMRTARSRYRRVEPNNKHTAGAAQGQKSKPASI